MGQRAFVGKICMDQNSPKDYIQQTADCLHDTKQFILSVRHDINNELIQPVITPRFIPTCSDQLLQGLGQLAKDFQLCHVQSHISESKDEKLHFCLLGFFFCERDTEIFDKFGLLTSRTIVAHANHCTDEDLKVLKQKGVGIAHCPLSNFYFANGCLPVKSLHEKYKLNVGLGTDVAGGYSPSMFNAMRNCVITSKLFGGDADMDYKHALYLATIGGAKCLGIDSIIGTFEIGKEFDALLLGVESNSQIDIFDMDTLDDIFQKIMTLGDDRDIKRVWVRGRDVTIISPTSKL
ncbi:hypothetical protein RFI_11435 [Reticulomyxa filosa]|uniref:Amidohydrolase-related domain-containing protein n=1 Tax=Reticulomyxa filosa TaxID=46433 RepID=X6NIH0_RETFI|nr:hypothetical protein RFI_11435 [Reticulomyxa filosa]|eukprot:ETO25703.1 hypothetical protein RFI_11435 [Reticulomyxa filosa]